MAKRLLLLNGVAIICVILFHASGFGFIAMFAWTHRYKPVTVPNYEAVGTGWYYGLRLVEQFITFCIPAFLFVSGYFVSVLAGRTGTTVGTRPLTARIRSLLVPYLFWSFVVLFGLALEGRVFSWSRYLRLLLTGSTNPNYYFVPLLVQLYLAAPLVVVLAKWRPKLLIACAAVMQAGIYALQYPIVLDADTPGLISLAGVLPKWLFLVHFFWFSSGVVAGLYPQPFKSTVIPLRRWILLATIALFILGVAEWEILIQWSGSAWRENRATLLDGLYSGAAILTFLSYSEVELPFSRSLSLLGTKSYGIYLVHGIVMEYFSRGMYHFAPWILGRQIIFQPLLIVLGLGVPLVLMALVSRSAFRGYYTSLFG